MNGEIRYSASWALTDEIAVYLLGDELVSIRHPTDPPPGAPYDHVILSGDLFAELKRSCIDRGIGKEDFPFTRKP